MNTITCPVCSETITTRLPLQKMDGSSVCCANCKSDIVIFCEHKKPTLTLPICKGCDRPIEGRHVHIESGTECGVYCAATCVPEEIAGMSLDEFREASRYPSYERDLVEHRERVRKEWSNA